MNIMHYRTTMAGASAVLLAAMAAGGCGANGSTAGEKEETTAAEQAPFTMTIYNNAGIADAYYQEYIEKHLKRKFPQATFHYTKRSQGNDIEDLVAAGTVPDLILFGVDRILTYRDLGVLADLTPLVKEQNIDISRFADGIIDTIKSYSEHGELYAMPWSYNPAALYYNKDIFDKFGVPYPKDGMSWDELGDLVKKLPDGRRGGDPGTRYGPQIFARQQPALAALRRCQDRQSRGQYGSVEKMVCGDERLLRDTGQ